MTSTLRQLKRATEIVERYRGRGNVLPRELSKCNRNTPETQQGDFLFSVKYVCM